MIESGNQFWKRFLSLEELEIGKHVQISTEGKVLGSSAKNVILLVA